MKTKAIIVLFWIMALIGAFSLKSSAQINQTGFYTIPSKPVLIADETTLIDTKTGARIECTSDKVHFKLYEKWQHAFVKYSWSWKRDRKGPYKIYVIYISKKDAQLIREWSKNNL